MLICGDEKQSKNSKMVGRKVLKVLCFHFKSYFLNLEFVVMKRLRAFEVKKCYESCQMFLTAFLVNKICKHP